MSSKEVKLLIATLIAVVLCFAGLIWHLEKEGDRRAYNTEYTIRLQRAYCAARLEQFRLQDSALADLGNDYSAEQFAKAVWNVPVVSILEFLDTASIMDSVKARREREN